MPVVNMAAHVNSAYEWDGQHWVLPKAYIASCDQLFRAAHQEVKLVYSSTLQPSHISWLLDGHRGTIGFDTESPPSFQRGQPANAVTLVQLATERRALLVHLRSRHDGPLILPDLLSDVLLDDSLVKVGAGLVHDVQLLCAQYGMDPPSRDAFRDLSSLAGPLQLRQHGLAALCAGLTGKRLAKSQSTSDWSRIALSQGQINYAALDAFISLRLYTELEELCDVHQVSTPGTNRYFI